METILRLRGWVVSNGIGEIFKTSYPNDEITENKLMMKYVLTNARAQITYTLFKTQKELLARIRKSYMGKYSKCRANVEMGNSPHTSRGGTTNTHIHHIIKLMPTLHLKLTSAENQ